MLGKDRFQFESPNAVDAGEAPPSAPGRRGGRRSGTRSPRSVASPTTTVGNNNNKERPIYFRGQKLEIPKTDGDDEESPARRTSISTTGSFEGSLQLEFYDGDEEIADSERTHDQLPSPDEARMYAAQVLTESFRRLDNDSEEEGAAAAALAAGEQGQLLSSSSSALSGWRRPSRRQSHLAQKNVLSIRHKEEKRRSFLFLSTTVCCSILLVGTAIAFFVVVTMVSFKTSNSHPSSAASNATSNSDSMDEGTPVDDVTTEMVTSPRFLKTIEWLVEHGVSSMDQLTSESSPQYLAARWIADTDRMQEDIPVQVVVDVDADYLQFNASAQEQHEAHQRHVAYERFLQRYILAVLYHATDGPNSWKDDLSFLSDNHECAWFKGELANDGSEYAVGVTCNDKLLVADLFLPGNNLVGSLPTELQFLRHLELLSLRHNAITGSIPTELATLSSTLQYLDLSKNNMVFSLPGDLLGSLTGLRALGLAGNMLHGTIPTELTRLTDLLTLDLGHNQKLTGHVQSTIGEMKQLRYLYLSHNQFEDTIDDSFLRHLSQLQELTLNNNKLKSIRELPFHLISHPNLTLLDLSNNALVGSLPSTFLSTSNSKTNVKILNLGHNSLNGTIPNAIQMLSNLEYLDMSGNSFGGAIPISMGNMKSLSHVYLGNNNFDEAIVPPVFFTDLNLKVLSLPNAQLIGQIPPWFGMLSSLTHLDLSNNRLTGQIPTDLWNLPSLTTLLLQRTMLSSELPMYYPHSQLEIVALDDNGGITGDASGICVTNTLLTTFSYSCEKVSCDGGCCNSQCCGEDVDSEECFSNLLASSLAAKEEEELHQYQANRTVFSFNPAIIREKHT